MFKTIWHYNCFLHDSDYSHESYNLFKQFGIIITYVKEIIMDQTHLMVNFWGGMISNV